MYHFCTYFDINYLPRALCLIDSLERHCPSFKIYALCLDAVSLAQLKRLNRPQVVPLGLDELEADVSELVAVKSTRSRLEYYYTCGPVFLDYIMKCHSEIDVLTFLDADLYFFHSPEALFEAFDGYSIGVVPHFRTERRRPPWQGKYNVGWINFRRDPNGLACLQWWRDRCIEWCYERYEDGKYADQLYLDQWPLLFNGLYEFTHRGANVAPWNIDEHHWSLRGGQVYVDQDPLIFYHFHNVRKITKHIYYTYLGLQCNSILRQHVIVEYIRCLEKYAMARDPTSSIRQYRPKFYVAKTLARLILAILFRHYVLVYKGHII